MSGRINRRGFLQGSALAGIGFWAAGGVGEGFTAPRASSERLNIACIGIKGKGDSDADQAAQVGNVIAICDIDDNYLDAKANQKDKKTGKMPFKQAQKFNDFREMLDKVKEIDAVTVSTPDHTHAPAAIMAMRLKKHVYCQKPLTHDVHQARLMRETAREKGVCTQMGNQGTASNGLRAGVEILRSGAIGDVKEVHVWTNRPIWPQGADAILRVASVREAAIAALRGRELPKVSLPSAPKNVHWDLFLGPAPERPYAPGYHPFAWRGWWDFGTGALGDMACHTANLPFMALKLGSPTTVQAEAGDINPETYPTWARITFQFPARGDMGPVKFVWYEGFKDSKRILPPDDLLAKVLRPREKLSDSGCLLVGDKGILFSPNDYGESYRLLPEDQFKDYKAPNATLPRNGRNDLGMKEEWVRAIMANKPEIALSNFDYAALLTETILLGNVAMRVGKKDPDGNKWTAKLDWDAEQLKVTNVPEAAAFIHPEFRKGWGV